MARWWTAIARFWSGLIIQLGKPLPLTDITLKIEATQLEYISQRREEPDETIETMFERRRNRDLSLGDPQLLHALWTLLDQPSHYHSGDMKL